MGNLSQNCNQALSGCHAPPGAVWPLSCGNGVGVTEGTPTPTFGTTIRIARVHHPCCLSWRDDDLRFVRTVGDCW